MTRARLRSAAPTADWQHDAACRGWPDPEDFFPDHAVVRPVALVVCTGCPVLLTCRDEALRSRQRYGIWGGMTESDRLQWWDRDRRRAAASRSRGA